MTLLICPSGWTSVFGLATAVTFFAIPVFAGGAFEAAMTGARKPAIQCQILRNSILAAPSIDLADSSTISAGTPTSMITSPADHESYYDSFIGYSFIDSAERDGFIQ